MPAPCSLSIYWSTAGTRWARTSVNTMCETIGPEVGELCKGVVVLKIISNLAVHRLARVTGVFTAKELSTSVTMRKRANQ